MFELRVNTCNNNNHLVFNMSSSGILSSVRSTVLIVSHFGCQRLRGCIGADRRIRPGGTGAVMIMLSANVLFFSLLLLLILSSAAHAAKDEGAVGKTDAYRSQFKGLDRILSRLDGSSGSMPPKSHHQPWSPPGTMHGSSGAPEKKSDLSPVEKTADHHHYQEQYRPLHMSQMHRRGNSDIFNEGVDMDNEDDTDVDDDDELVDEDDSYEDEDEDEGDLLNDKMSSWANSYRNRYLSQRDRQTSTTSTTTTTTTTTTPSPQLSYSQWKWQHLGTRQALDQTRRDMSLTSQQVLPSNNKDSRAMSNTGTLHSRRHHGYDSSPNYHHTPHHHSSSHHENIAASGSSISRGKQSYSGGSWTPAQSQSPRSLTTEAIQHALKVRREGDCRIPKPRIVKVQDFYPHPSKSYVPHCTILHHCSDETGCCKYDMHTCSPKTTERVELAFYTYYLDQSRASMVEKLVFYNHTECECRDKLDEMMPRDAPDPYLSSVSSTSAYANSQNTHTHTGYSKRETGLVKKQHAAMNSLCRCPEAFTQRTLSDGSCSCDCFDKDNLCLRLKRGREFFPLRDKWCIQSGRCEVPECSFGPYIHLIGRCPLKKERSGENTTWTRYLTTP